jgi:copper chaperone NosL
MRLLSRLPIYCTAMMVLLAGCYKATFAPVAIESTDMCSFCRMSISEVRYAAELIDSDEQAFKFDDVGCMVNFIKQKRSNAPVRATFVMDYEHREWLKAGDAFYVRSSELRTPMNGGIVAFKDRSSAEAAVTKYHGTLLQFAEVTK